MLIIYVEFARKTRNNFQLGGAGSKVRNLITQHAQDSKVFTKLS
jgi:hypothetical protein